jgi:hypothetical protein
VSKGTTVLGVFAPFWFVNKTRRTLRFRGHDNSNEIVVQAEVESLFRIRIHMFLGLPDPDPLVRGMDPDPSIIKQNS